MMIPKKVFLICNYYENAVLWQIHNEYMILKILNMHFFNISANYMHLVQKKRTWWPDMSLDFEGGGVGNDRRKGLGWRGLGRTIWKRRTLIHVFLLYFILLRFIGLIFEKLKGEGMQPACTHPSIHQRSYIMRNPTVLNYFEHY